MAITSAKGFFKALREKGWALRVPERIHQTHQDGVAKGWFFFSDNRIPTEMESLKTEGLLIPIHYRRFYGGESAFSRLSENCSPGIMKHFCEYNANKPASIPDNVLTSDTVWDSINVNTGKNDNRWFNYGDCVYSVFALPIHVTNPASKDEIWSTLNKKYKQEYHNADGNDLEEKKIGRRETREQRKIKRDLREKYALDSDYWSKNNAYLFVLRKIYSPTEIRATHWLILNRMENPSNVVRFGIQAGMIE